MKMLVGEMTSILATRERPRIGVLIRFLVILLLMVTSFAVIFKVLMAREGNDHTWVTAFYWVLTVMSTLGFGDITFHSDLGRLFSIVVLLSGMLFLLVLLPFIFIEFFYQPWLASQKSARTPRSLKRGTRDHVIITHLDAVSAEFIRRLDHYERDYVLLVDDADEALRLLENGYKVVVGAADDPATYRALRIENAAMVAATGSDPRNTLIASTVREVSATIPIIATADDAASVDVLMLAGCQQVLHLSSMMAAALARRVTGGDFRAHIIGDFDGLLLAEANASPEKLAGRTIRDSQVRNETGVGIVGVWQRGAFRPAAPDMMLHEKSLLLLAGSRAQFADFNRIFGGEARGACSVLILGGGRVGRSTARALRQSRTEYRVVERDARRPEQDERWIIGNAAELEVLREAGIEAATTVVITTHEDDMNVYLTLYCRNLRPEAEILSRATDRRNVAALHRAGADFVLSYAAMGASQLFNAYDSGTMMNIAEGLNLFRVPMPEALFGKTLAESQIRQLTGATVVAIEDAAGKRFINPLAPSKLQEGHKLILVGDPEAEQAFLRAFD